MHNRANKVTDISFNQLHLANIWNIICAICKWNPAKILILRGLKILLLRFGWIIIKWTFPCRHGKTNVVEFTLINIKVIYWLLFRKLGHFDAIGCSGEIKERRRWVWIQASSLTEYRILKASRRHQVFLPSSSRRLPEAKSFFIALLV